MGLSAVLSAVCLNLLLQYSKADFTCTSVGRFADPSDATCTNFYVCSKKSSGEFIVTAASCSSGKFFDPDAHRCSSSYECAATSTSVTTTEATTTEETTTSSTATTEAEDFTCTATGRYNNPSDLLCKTYYLCSLYGGNFIKTLYKCPSVSVFDPDLHKCSASYTCSYVTTEEPTTTSTTISPETTTYENIPEEEGPPISDFSCYTRGRFANSNDESCKWYYLCNQLRNGSFIQTPYSCPKNSVFDQEIEICSTLYTCPYLSTGLSE